jgi:hypothetical protein
MTPHLENGQPEYEGGADPDDGLVHDNVLASLSIGPVAKYGTASVVAQPLQGLWQNVATSPQFEFVSHK